MREILKHDRPLPAFASIRRIGAENRLIDRSLERAGEPCRQQAAIWQQYYTRSMIKSAVVVASIRIGRWMKKYRRMVQYSDLHMPCILTCRQCRPCQQSTCRQNCYRQLWSSSHDWQQRSSRPANSIYLGEVAF